MTPTRPADHPVVKPQKIGVLLLNLGTPDATDYWSVRRYLSEFLSDPRVIETRAEVTYSGAQHGSLGTALRDYPNSQTAIATPAVRTSLAEDLYVTLLASDDATGAVTLHLFVNPLVVWIWIGGAIVGIAAVFAIWPERRSRPVVVEQPQPVAAPATVEGG